MVGGTSDRTTSESRKSSISKADIVRTPWGHTREVRGVDLSADGRRAVTGAYDNTARVWDARTGATLLELNGHQGPVTSVVWSADGTRIVTGSEDNTARVWDAKTGATLLQLTGHERTIRCVAISADGSRIVTASLDKTARVWDTKTGTTLLELKGHTNQVWSVAVSPDGSRIITGSADNTARVWDGKTGTTLVELKGHSQWVNNVAWSADGSRIVTGSLDGCWRVWNAKTGEYLPDEPLPRTPVSNRLTDGRQALVLADGRLVLIAGKQFHRVLLVEPRPSKAEVARRRWLARPDPEWHGKLAGQFDKANNPFAAALHRSFEQHARGVLAFEVGDFDRAWGHFIIAAVIKPQPPKLPALAPPPRPVNR